MIHVAMRLALAAAAVGTFLGLLTTPSHAQIVSPVSEVTFVVVDETGARITGSELVLKCDSKAVVSHTGNDGAVTITLPSGQYAVTVSARGFVQKNVLDFPVVAPAPGELKVVMKGDPGSSLSPCGQCPAPTTTSDLPNVIADEPSPVPPVRPATKTRKSRSPLCLYLWKCSAS